MRVSRSNVQVLACVRSFCVPVRATITSFGPTLLSRVLGLNDVQQGVLNIAFRIADEQKLLLLDLIRRPERPKLVKVAMPHPAEEASKLGQAKVNILTKADRLVAAQILAPARPLDFFHPLIEIVATVVAAWVICAACPLASGTFWFA